MVDVFDTDGDLLTPNHFAANAPGAGPLENPWGITQAPANFGAYSNDLLIGNVAGAGNINVFDPVTGAYLGQLHQPDGTPIAIKGLWDLEFGDGMPDSGKTNQLFFDAGPNKPGDSTGGLFGVIRAAGDQGGNGGGNLVLARWRPSRATTAGAGLHRGAPASYLGEEAGNQVWISPNAAGWEWNLDASTATGRRDLGGVLDHEFAHLLGWKTATNFRM